MELRFWAATDTGQVRDHNEDNFLVDQNLQLFVVCDGMGGHAAGEVASAVCVRTVREVVASEQELIERLESDPEDRVALERLKQLMRRAVETANARIFQMSNDDSTRRGMGTTCVAQLIVGRRLFVGHVGDSRIYRLRGEEIEQITDDHSLLNEMIRQGQVPPDMTEAEFPHNNAVTRAVGVRETVDVDAFFVEVEPGDRYLMCSDGLSEYLEGYSDPRSLMATGEPEETTEQCITFANESGGKDNITVVVLDCERAVVKQDDGAGPAKAEVIEMLRKTAYFHYLEGPELEQVRQMAERLELEADEDVIADGEDNHRLFLILKGSVSLQLDGEQVSVLTTGEHFGEMALIDAQDEKDENMVARTLEPSIFLAIGRARFLGLIRGEPNLAIKLLWNFVQVFADRLQSVPPEFRFTPDEWRSDPEAIADVTPPSGTLVFEDDLDRKEKREEEKEGSDEAAIEVARTPNLPDLPPLGEVRSGLSEVTAPGAGSLDSDASQPEDKRVTQSLDALDRDALADSSSESPSEPEEEAPAVQINTSSSPEDGESTTEAKPQLEVGDVSEDHGFKRDEPTAQIDKPDFAKKEEESSSKGRAARSELSKTVEINWEDAPPEKREQLHKGPPPPPDEGIEEGDEVALRETVSMDANVDELRRIRDQQESTKAKPTPSASILKKAAKKETSESPPDSEESEPSAADNGGKRVAISGQAQVTEGEEEVPEEEEPKIMISSDLMAEGEEMD